MKNIVQGNKYRFTVLNSHVVRLEYSDNGVFVDLPSQSILNRPTEETKYFIIENENRIEIATDFFHVYYKKEENFSPESLYADFKFNYQLHISRWYYGDKTENLGGTIETVDRLDGGTKLGSGLISRNGYTIFDDSHTALLAEKDEIIERKRDTKDIYLFAFGHDYLGAIRFFYFLSGFPPQLPRYALGNWWSRYWAYTDESYKKLMEDFEEAGIPFSVAVIDMDWHVTNIPERFGSGWTGYTWNRLLFPYPEKFIAYLHKKGLAVALNDHPAEGVRACEEKYPKIASRLGLNTDAEEPAVFDFSSAAYRNAFFEEIYRPLEKMGVDFWWIDWQQGQISAIHGVTPLWLLNHFNFKDIKANGKAPLILSRFSGAGSHRYPVGFSGDVIVSWASLDFQPYMSATASNIGYTWWSHDIGGHMMGINDNELTLRWMQFGVFSPINRLHSSNSPFFKKEPLRYPKEVRDIMTRYLRLRRELIPYLETANFLTANEGVPLLEPLYYKHPDENWAYCYKNSYYFGPELFVAPITQKSDAHTHRSTVKTHLPNGLWFDFFTNDVYLGGSEIALSRAFDNIPVFAKEGAIIPMEPFEACKKITELPDLIEWIIFPGTSNSYTMIESVGKNVAKTTLIYEESKEMRLVIDDPRRIIPEGRRHRFSFRGCQSFEITGVKTRFDDEKREMLTEEFFNKNLKIPLKDFCVSVVKDRKKAIFQILDEAEIAYDIKDTVWHIVNNNISILQMIQSFQAIDNESLKVALFEQLYLWQKF